jgi:hypothetical protein
MKWVWEQLGMAAEPERGYYFFREGGAPIFYFNFFSSFLSVIFEAFLLHCWLFGIFFHFFSQKNCFSKNIFSILFFE